MQRWLVPAFFFILLLSFTQVKGGLSTIDSLQQELKKQQADSERVSLLNQISEIYINRGKFKKAMDSLIRALQLANQTHDLNGQTSVLFDMAKIQKQQSNYDSALTFYQGFLKVKQQQKDTEGIAKAYNNFGIIYDKKGSYDTAIHYTQKAVQLFNNVNDPTGMGNAYGNLATIYYKQSNYVAALKYYGKSVKQKQLADNKEGIATTYNNIGSIYVRQNNYKKAVQAYQKSIKIKRKIGDTIGLAFTYGGLANVHQYRGQYKQAIKLYQKSLAILRERGIRRGVALSYTNIGNVYVKAYNADTVGGSIEVYTEQGYQPYTMDKLLDSAVVLFRKARKVFQKIGDKRALTFTLTGLGDALVARKKYQKAVQLYQKAFELASVIGALNRMKEAAHGSYKVYDHLNQTDQALIWLKRYIKYKDSIFSKKKQRKIGRLESRFTWQQKQMKDSLQHVQKMQEQTLEHQHAMQQQRIMLYSAGGGLLLVIVFSLVLYNRYRTIHKQRDQINRQKQEVDKAYGKLQQKNRQITSSISYAKRIQDALLKEEEHVTPDLPSHFVLLKPQSTVSGDFYWSVLKEDEWYVAVADCTGHGVPGGFLTMLGTAFLNEITSVQYQVSPADILNQLRERFIKELGEDEEVTDSGMRMRDGMDISLVRMNLETGQAYWAGANNPLYVVRQKYKPNLQDSSVQEVASDEYKLFDLSPDKQPISYTSDPKPFTEHAFKLHEDDTIYLFSDGYPDQFGGPKGKKFMYKRFKQFLMEVQQHSIYQQKTVLDERIESWMAQNNEEQIDDICILGIRV